MLMRKSLVVFFPAIAVVLIAAGMQQDINNNGRKQMQMAEPNGLTVDVNNISITVIYDNNPYKEGLETSWGFSCVITGTEKNILFDMGGNGQLLLENMSKTGINANDIDIVVLSHIHGDHTGGLEEFLRENPKVTVFLPESFPKEFKAKVTFLTTGVVEVDKQTEICKNVYSTGQLGASIKEQGLVLRTEKGLVVVTGCAHPGIVEMVKAAKSLFDEQVLLVMGGFHLEWATKGKIEKIIKDFKDMNVKYAGPCHCTGNKARSIFAEHFGDNYINIGVGKTIRIEDLK